MEYAYLMASLPRLELQGDLPLTSADLLRSSDGVLSPSDWEDLRAIVEDRPQDVRASADVRRFLDGETQLRNALSRLRATRAGAQSPPARRPHAGFETRIEALATVALATEDPLERELLLDRHRWRLLTEIAALPAFGRQAVFAYAFRLRLAEKWAALSEEGGLHVVRQVVEGNLAGSGV